MLFSALFILIILFILSLPVLSISFIVTGYRKKMPLTLTFGIIGSIITLAIIGFIIMFAVSMSWATSKHTNPRQYSRALRDVKNRADVIELFPPIIPADVSNVHFYYHPHVLMGPMELQLRYQTSPEQIQALYKRFTSQKHVLRHGGSWDIGTVPMFFTGDNPPQSENRYVFPEDYDIIILFPRPHGVAISKKRNEIVYWAFGGGDSEIHWDYNEDGTPKKTD